MAACDGMILLRRAREGDARGIAEVHVRTWQHAYRDLLAADTLRGLSADVRERFWKTQLHLPPESRHPWLAESDGEVVGFVSVGPSRDEGEPGTTGEVYAIYVGPECWDKGVGRNLLAHGERDLAGHGYHEATLWVMAENERGRRFYEAAGWHVDGAERTEEIGGHHVQEVRYRHSLS